VTQGKPSVALCAAAIALASVSPVAGAMALSGDGADVAGAPNRRIERGCATMVETALEPLHAHTVT
jgi:hypothetical protein